MAAAPGHGDVGAEEPQPVEDYVVGGLPLDGITLVDPDDLARAIELTRAVLAIRLSLPQPGTALEDYHQWRTRTLRRWEARRRLAVQEAMAAARELRGTAQGLLAGRALGAAIHADAIAQIDSVPVPTDLKDDPTATGWFRARIAPAVMADRMRVGIAFGSCWQLASHEGPGLEELAAACLAGATRHHP